MVQEENENSVVPLLIIIFKLIMGGPWNFFVGLGK